MYMNGKLLRRIENQIIFTSKQKVTFKVNNDKVLPCWIVLKLVIKDKMDEEMNNAPNLTLNSSGCSHSFHSFSTLKPFKM